jgi:hypothetical protein
MPGVSILVADFDSGLPENNSIKLFGFESDLGFGADEVGVAGGDSGGPMFIGGAIAGVNLATAQPPPPFTGDVNNELDASWGEAGFFMRVSSYRDFILVATGGKAIFVPEPSTVALLISAITVPAMGSRTRRRGRVASANPAKMQSRFRPQIRYRVNAHGETSRHRGQTRIGPPV